MRGISVLFSLVSVFACQASAAPSFEERELIAVLIETLDDPDGEVRQNIAVAISRMGDLAVPALIEALGDEKPQRRAGAAVALGQIRPEARSAIPALLKAVKDKDEVVRRQASYALSRIVGRDSVPVIKESKPVVPPLDPVPGSDK